MVIGVTSGYAKTLEIVGTGYRVQAKGSDLEFALGFSHPVLVTAPDGITFRVETPTRFAVEGIDKQQVGEVAANIRKLRKPDPYKGKGVRYQGEVVRRKAGRQGRSRWLQPAFSRRPVVRPDLGHPPRRPVPPALPAAQEGRRHRRASASGRRPARSRHLFVQVVDDATGATAGVGLDVQADRRRQDRPGPRGSARSLADAAKAAGITQVVFDRGGNTYTGRVAAFADAAREGGLEF